MVCYASGFYHVFNFVVEKLMGLFNDVELGRTKEMVCDPVEKITSATPYSPRVVSPLLNFLG